MGTLREPSLHYGEDLLKDFLPPAVLREERLLIPFVEPGLSPLEDVSLEVERLLEKSSEPGTPSLGHILNTLGPDALISLILDDHTRPNIHTRLILPPLLASIKRRGFAAKNLFLVIATGTHRPSHREELLQILGNEIFSEYADRIVVHDCRKNLSPVGRISDGTMVRINKTAFCSNLLIALTDMEFHYFTGIAGGPKSVIPGIGGKEIVNAEHVRMFGSCGFAPGVGRGSPQKNPVFQYKLECIRLIQERMRSRGDWLYSINAVVDGLGRLIFLNGGDILGSFYRAIPPLRRTWTAVLKTPADVVIINARHEGINLLQAGKAFNSAARAVRPGGRIVVLAPCPDGFGNDEFKDLMRISADIFRKAGGQITSNTIDEAITKTQCRILKGFKMGYQKPVDLLMTLRHAGWRHLYLLQDGLHRGEADEILPFMQVLDAAVAPPPRILSELISAWEGERPRYLILDEPGLLFEVFEPYGTLGKPVICPS